MSDDIVDSLEERTDDVDYAELIREEMHKMLNNPSNSLIDRFVVFHYSITNYTKYSPIFAAERWFKSASLCKKDFEKFVSFGEDVKWLVEFCEFAYDIGVHYATQQIKPLREKPRRSMRFLYKTMLSRLENDSNELTRLKSVWKEGPTAFEAYVFS